MHFGTGQGKEATRLLLGTLVSSERLQGARRHVGGEDQFGAIFHGNIVVLAQTRVILTSSDGGKSSILQWVVCSCARVALTYLHHDGALLSIYSMALCHGGNQQEQRHYND
jgi:hypothetical protein